MKQALTDSLMEQAQGFASTWSLVNGVFDDGDMLEQANTAKADLRDMIEKALADKDTEIAALKSLLSECPRYIVDTSPKAIALCEAIAQAVQP